jgi:peptide/nickel transport system substrate-binding protein
VQERSKLLRQINWVFVIVSLSLVLTACSANNDDKSDPQNSIVYGLTLEPSGIDPHIYQSTELGIVARQVYDTLVYRNPETREIVPGLATDWLISEDGLSYTFTLRNDVTFHDGSLFNAQAVAANLDRIVDPDTASQKARFMLGTYTGYEIIDDFTIRLDLTEPYTPLLDALSQVYLSIASPTALNEYSLNRYQFHQVGTGPFRFIEYVPNDRIVLERFDEYNWGPEFYDMPSATSLDRVIFRFFTDESTRLIALESGDADIMGEIPPVDARTLSGSNQISLIPVAVPGQPLQFMFNTTQYPTDNIVVRQAILHAINRSAIVDTIFQGFSPPAWGPISSETQYYNTQVVGSYEFNTQLARELLEGQGFSDTDNNGFIELSGIELELRIFVPPWGSVPEISQLIQSQLRDIGIRVALEQVPNFNTLRSAIETGEYNLVSFDTPGFDPAFLNDYFITNSVRNWMGYSNPQLDSILMDAFATNDVVRRQSLYAEAQRIIMNDALILPIREYVNLNAATPNVQNLEFDVYGWFPILNNVTIQEN